MSKLLDAIVDVAAELPRSVLEKLCGALDSLPSSATATQRLALAQSLTQPLARSAATHLMQAWNADRLEIRPDALALAIRTAIQAEEELRKRQSVEVVWTGPAPEGAKLRRTEQALLDVIERARHELLLVAYTAYRLPRVSEALVSAAARGVRITFVAESSQVSEGKVTFGALESLGSAVSSHATVYVWPLEQRARDEAGRHGSLHIKCAVADEDTLFVSSANLTDFAVRINMELGVLIRGGAAPRWVVQHVRGLIAAGVLVEA